MPSDQRAPARPTIREVAQAAGVSSATVSRHLNGGRWVSPDAAAAVDRAVRETGYTANVSARALATGRAHSVAFIVTEKHDALFSDPTFSALIKGSAQALSERNMALILLVAGTEQERENVSRFVASGHVDGVMLVSSHEAEPLLEALLRSNVRTVSCGLPLGHQGDLASVSIDEAGSAAVMAQYLLDRGHRRIAMIAGPSDTPGGRFRLEGFRATMGDLFDPALVVGGDYSIASGSAATTELLDAGAQFDAVFAASDSMAVGAIATLTRAGYRVPDDIAVSGFDDSGLAAEHDPPITTMRQPWAELSRQMVSLLLDQEDVHQVTLPTELIVRTSA